MTSDVLVIGETIMDIVIQNEHRTERPGGSPANVALGLGRLGHSVELLTRIGNDTLGRTLQSHLTASNVHIFPTSIVDGASATAVATIDENGAASYEFDVTWTLPRDEVIDTNIIHTGSVAAFLAPGSSAIQEYLALSGSTLVSFDPNIRPALIGNHAAALRTFESIVALSDIVKLSDEDAAWLYPERDTHDVLARIRDIGATLAAITLGDHGAMLAGRGFDVFTPSEKVHVQDTIGAGDTFMAALLHDVTATGRLPLDADDAHRMGVFATRAAAITVSRAGADLPHTNDLL